MTLIAVFFATGVYAVLGVIACSTHTNGWVILTLIGCLFGTIWMLGPTEADRARYEAAKNSAFTGTGVSSPTAQQLTTLNPQQTRLHDYLIATAR